ncbi:uncharacterized protein LOC121775522 [Salvia splendens]|uniref:uncharacterized protein LOC121775522 n=1 Tax=Salvia splendens TaxID=180675 RepID=UPI001C27D3A1|nr:uncharacterized protein LOC121775522 [Salvia splendens]XP_042028536.1 uncharacterized protein LOC121775522 [Salvia splendens]
MKILFILPIGKYFFSGTKHIMCIRRCLSEKWSSITRDFLVMAVQYKARKLAALACYISATVIPKQLGGGVKNKVVILLFPLCFVAFCHIGRLLLGARLTSMSSPMNIWKRSSISSLDICAGLSGKHARCGERWVCLLLTADN